MSHLQYPPAPIDMVLASDIYEAEEESYILHVLVSVGKYHEAIALKVQMQDIDDGDFDGFAKLDNEYRELIKNNWPK